MSERHVSSHLAFPDSKSRGRRVNLVVLPLEWHVKNFLRPTNVINHDDADVRALAADLGRDAMPRTVAARCFAWVRDNIRHSLDHNDNRVTLSAAEVLRYGTGLCYSKSHLLAALLRANEIPCGLVYQRLATSDSGSSFCLHGLNAVWLPEFDWYRMTREVIAMESERRSIHRRSNFPLKHQCLVKD